MSEAQYMKPGQKYPAPSPGAGDRVFYETLLKEKPNCEMALNWCIEHGVLNGEELNGALARAAKFNKKAGGGIVPVAATTHVVVAKAVSASKGGAKASKVVDVSVDAGMSVGGDARIGSVTL